MSLLSDKTNVTSNREIEDKNELLLRENSKRFVMFPIKYGDIWKAYKESLGNIWLCEQVEWNYQRTEAVTVEYDNDVVRYIVSYWAQYEEQPLLHSLSGEIQIAEARAFFGFQINTQITHLEMFSILFNKLNCQSIKVDNINNSLNRKTALLKIWFKRLSFAGRIVVYSIMESIFTCSIDLLREVAADIEGKLIDLSKICSLFIKDKTTYTKFGKLLYNYCVQKLSQEDFSGLIKEAVSAETDFLNIIFRSAVLPRVTAESRLQYVHYKADSLCELFAHDKIYNKSNPFE